MWIEKVQLKNICSLWGNPFVFQKNSPVSGLGGLSEMSNIKMSNRLTMDEVHQKIYLTQWSQFWGEIWKSSKILKTCFINFLKLFNDHYMWPQNWPHYVWTSLCQVKIFMHLIHSQSVWLFDIFLTYGVMGVGESACGQSVCAKAHHTHIHLDHIHNCTHLHHSHTHTHTLQQHSIAHISAIYWCCPSVWSKYECGQSVCGTGIHVYK